MHGKREIAIITLLPF